MFNKSTLLRLQQEIFESELQPLLERETDEAYKKIFILWENAFPEELRLKKRDELSDLLWEILRTYRIISYYMGLQHGISFKRAIEDKDFTRKMLERLYRGGDCNQTEIQ